MKRFFSFVVVLMVLLLLSSSMAPQRRGLKVGSMAPDVMLCDTALIHLGSDNERYTLLHFWASYDAPSRIANKMYNETVNRCDSTRVRYVAVSYERNEALYGEIIRRDKLSAHSQYYDPHGSHSVLYERYRLDKGFASYLIDAQGKIIAHNPDPHTLSQLIGQ